MYSDADFKAKQYVSTLDPNMPPASRLTAQEDYAAGYEAGQAGAMMKLLGAKAALEQILSTGGQFSELASISIAERALRDLGFRK